uniref:Tumor necrosis factor receptor superfamily member 10B n=1 Tax=Pelodiscus sinensis TaxID=13735 RepID=K7GIE4_PELSI|nr:tumor necrosis factor receptor superfamily member 10B [Pelodiscus sinensis]|eukprot:XP_006135590.1 tumor necrosis factor receptor superfamily member 10B [Pelodiscus sinensis]
MSPGLASVLLLLLCAFAHEARPASISLTRSLEGPRSIPRAFSHSTEDSEFDEHEDHLRKTCPAGFYLNASMKCDKCEEGIEFTEFPNALSRCLPCHVCRKDEVQLSPCHSSKDTQCACKNGTFCSPDHPCEICQKCRTRCPEGEVQVSSCTLQSDIQCAHPTSPPPAAGRITGMTVAGILVLLAVVGALLGVWWWRRRNRKSSSEGDPTKKSASIKAHHILSPLRNCARRRPGTQDNMRNEQLDQESRSVLLTVSDPEEAAREESQGETRAPQATAPKLEVLQQNPASGMASKRRKLVPIGEQNPIDILRCSFEIFTQEVPFKDWRRFGRALLLSENEIELAERSDKYSQEPHYQMLNTWQNKTGAGASVNQLLETLEKIDLRGVADIIRAKLTDLYKEEELN